ncbi:MAG: 16S rRNA (cytidine(1402)-2'-O)-methyltransferase [bacterium]|nr:16S rRNA (cytidine(1402)-2'-O)-methyltransferase [bacterium]
MPTLYIIATPIGNLEDMTLRALRILKEVDTLFCEDTRVTGKLLAHFGISKPLLSLRERVQDKAIEKAIALLQDGKDIAYATDAGTPGISDPGGKLVAQVVRALGSTVTISPVPGPSALIAASSIAGTPLDRFLFMGFPPHKKKRKKFFEEIVLAQYPVIFYESPHRIIRSLRELKEADNKKQVTKVIVCRELTKKFETVYRGTFDEILPEIEKNPRGEFVIIVS